MTATYDSNPDFVTAVSLFAALEGRCIASDSWNVLPYLGMARAELTDYGQRLPSHLDDLNDVPLTEGLDELEKVLTRMLTASEDLAITLRLRASRELLREGRAR